MKLHLILSALFLITACSSGNGADAPTQPASAETGLSAFELEHGIGPIKESMSIGDINMDKADLGKTIFDSKCMSCHKFGDRYVGPDLAQIMDTRSPEYIMNMMLNPAEMVQKHPDARAKLAEYMTPMPYQNVSEEDARNILEYIRTQQTNQQ